MSGVVIDGVQWEHCAGCRDWVRIENLGFLKPTKARPHQHADLCVECVDTLIQTRVARFEDIIPARTWVVRAGE